MDKHHKPKDEVRRARPCAATFSLSIVNTPVTRCRANSRADCWRQDKNCFSRCAAERATAAEPRPLTGAYTKTKAPTA